MQFRFAAALALALACALPVSVTAAEIEPPRDEVVLTVSGLIQNTNADGAARFDIAMLESLPKRVTETETPWTKGKVRFEGPLLGAILDKVGAGGRVVRITALNDYSVEVPIEDFRKWPVILATRKDGRPMPVRDKGPLFVIYPFDAAPDLYNEKIFARSVWQVKAIELR